MQDAGFQRANCRIAAVKSLPGPAEAAAAARAAGVPPAVVADVGWVNGLAAIRSLGRAGAPVFAIDHRPGALGFRSRYGEARSLARPRGRRGGLRRAPRGARRRAGRPAPIFPTHDEQPERDRAQPRTRSASASSTRSPAGTCSGPSSASATSSSGRAAGSDVPDAIPAPPRRRRAADELGYPVLVKPSDPTGFRREFRRQAFRCETPRGARATPTRRREPYDPMVQELIPGGDDELYTLGSYLDRDGEAARGLLAAASSARRRRSSARAASARPSGSRRSSSRASRSCAAFGFHGLSQVEFKRDPRDGALQAHGGQPAALPVARPRGRVRRRPPAGRLLRPARARRPPPARSNGSGKRWAITLMRGSKRRRSHARRTSTRSSRSTTRGRPRRRWPGSCGGAPLIPRRAAARWVLDTLGAATSARRRLPYRRGAPGSRSIGRASRGRRARRGVLPPRARRGARRRRATSTAASRLRRRCLDPLDPPLERLRAELGLEPPRWRGARFAVALTPRRRHAVALDARRRARLRRAAEGARCARRGRGAARGARSRRPCRSTGCAAPTRTGASSGSLELERQPAARRRPSSSWPATRTRTTGRRRRRTTGCGRASSRRSRRAAARSGSTAATRRPRTPLGSPTRRRRSRRSPAAVARPALPLPPRRPAREPRAARRARAPLRLDARLPRRARVPRRHRASVPALGPRHDRPLDLVEIPLAAMDVTLAEERYLGLSAREAERRLIALLDWAAEHGGGFSILWHTDRFDPATARGWDRLYAAPRRGARARRRLPLGRGARHRGRRMALLTCENPGWRHFDPHGRPRSVDDVPVASPGYAHCCPPA